MHKFLLMLLCTNYVGGLGKENSIKNPLLKKIESNQDSMKKDLENLRKEIQDVSEGLGYLLPTDCSEVKRRKWSKVAKIKPPGLSIRDVQCDHHTLGGGWTVVVSRNAEHKIERETAPAFNKNNKDSFINFNRTWEEYRLGFGNPRTEYWIGNDVVHALTKEGNWEAMVILEDWNGDKGQGRWGKFKVLEGKKHNYKLEISQFKAKESTVGDGLKFHTGKTFSTFDFDSGYNNGEKKVHCAKSYGGGWWFGECHVSFLTGVHLKKGEHGNNSVQWRNWKEIKSLKKAFLMIRPNNLLK